MDKIIGNFLTQANKDFPLDCETLEMLQNNAALVSALGNMAGDKAILMGCTPSQGGAQRSEGYVFLRTRAYPLGEILRFEGGATASGIYVRQEDIAITAQGYNYPKAYTRRALAAGVGEENYVWSDFKEVPTSSNLDEALKRLREDLTTEAARFAPAPLGIVQMWAGSAVPTNYRLCDGAALRIADYPELYAALGTTFNKAISANGSAYTTGDGFFRLPDLRGRFVVGRHDTDSDYMQAGTAGGEKKHTLTESELPTHSHLVHDYFICEKNAYENVNIDGRVEMGDRTLGSHSSDTDNLNMYYKDHNTEIAGNGSAHENRPPYYVLAYIMRLK